MKRIIYFLSIVLVSALYSCTGQYDNIDQYATDETVYIGKFSDEPYIRSGYKRLEIELMGDSIGRAFSDDLYLGKAKKTIIEYDEADGRRRLEYDSVCSWVNIKGLTTAKTYIFTIYAEDRFGNKSISTEAMGKPYTDADFEGITFPMPRVISTPTTVEFAWENEVSEGLSSPLYKFVELIYSFVDADENTVSGKLTAKDAPSFNIKNLKFADSTAVIVNCRIIPVMESGLILDTLSIVKEILSITTSEQEYLEARDLRPIRTALINPDDENKATITFGNQTAHLKWTEIRYKNNSGDWTTIRVNNDETTKECPDFERRSIFQIRCAYNPPETDIELVSEWADGGTFILKRDPRLENWAVIPRTGWHNWSDRPQGWLWPNGHPMLILDAPVSNLSGWHSVVHGDSPFPQVLIVDMKEKRRISQIVGSNGAYLKNVEIYLTDNLSIAGYSSHTIDWESSSRESNYNSWVTPLMSQIPANVPASWGEPVARGIAPDGGNFFFSLPQVLDGQFLIIRFPDNNAWSPEWPATYTCIDALEVYSD